jgi:glutamyl-tRNA reductase
MSAAVPLPWPEQRGATPELRPAADAGGAIAALEAYGDDVLAESLARADRRLRNLPPDVRRIVEAVAARIVDEFLRAPSLRLREAAVSPEGNLYARVVHELFADENPLVR